MGQASVRYEADRRGRFATASGLGADLRGSLEFESEVEIQGARLAVRKIGRMSFAGAKLQHVVVSSSIISICGGAFERAESLLSVAFADPS
jgi:hypothetical protein